MHKQFWGHSFVTVKDCKTLFCKIWLRCNATDRIVQIIHVWSDHWVVISNHFWSENNLRVYVTVFINIDNSTMSLLNSMFSKDNTVTLAPLQKQQGGVDCGVFSIAIAASLLHVIPGSYTLSLLQSHLIKCFENKLLLPFPWKLLLYTWCYVTIYLMLCM